jgi:hypothetical protein
MSLMAEREKGAVMKEADWLACIDPEPMLDYLHGRATERKLRLFACAWAWEVWHLMGDERSRNAVLSAERFADGLASQSDLVTAYNAAQAALRDSAMRVRFGGRHGKRLKSPKGTYEGGIAAEVARITCSPITDLLRSVSRMRWRNKAAQRVALAEVLRDLFGNPFRSPFLDPNCLNWNDRTVHKLAQAIYAEGRFADLPILADALEDAGCTDADVLNHCRTPGEHVRGCWVVDLLLGKQ